MDKLGNGDALGPLSFVGPYLLRCGEPLFPAPLHLMEAKSKDGDKNPLTFLKPGAEMTTDLGPVRLPEPEDKETKGFKPLEGAYLTREAMQTVLSGHPPKLTDIVQGSNLWKSEARVGIHRQDETRTTGENALYQTAHVRLQKGVSLGVGVSGYGDTVPDLAALGGESRMVGIEFLESFELPRAPSVGNRYTVTLITPGCFPDDGWKTPNGTLPGLSGRIVSACVGKPVLIGGWDSEKNNPKALAPYLPPGSVWFMEGDGAQAADLHGKHIGEKTPWGYGQILIGAW